MITQKEIDAFNLKIPINYLWDGFWIDSFKKQTLNISAAFDSIYSRDVMIVYKGVSFFNLPERWRDSNVVLPWMRLADRQAFQQQFSTEDINDKSIIEWVIYNSFENTKESFFIVCKKIFVFKCTEEESTSYLMSYKDPAYGEQFKELKIKNRIPLLLQNRN